MSKILILDNSAGLLETMEYILAEAGHTVNTLITASDVYRKINELQPDLLILDIYLSGNDGRDICKQLKSTADNKQLCILVYSTSLKLLQDYKSYQADDFLEKPFELKNLLEKIDSLLQVSRSRTFAVEY